MFLKLTCDLCSQNLEKLLTTPVPEFIAVYSHDHPKQDYVDPQDIDAHAEIVEILERNHDAKFYEHPNGSGLIINPCKEERRVTLMFQLNDGDEFDMFLTAAQKDAMRRIPLAFC